MTSPVSPRILFLLATFLTAPFLLGAAKCTNSGPTAQGDLAAHYGTTAYVDVLANDTEPDGERLVATVTGGTCQSHGTVAVALDLVQFLPSSEAVPDCTVTYQATDERGNTGSAVLTLVNAASIFVDGFELGSTGAWSSTCNGTGC